MELREQGPSPTLAQKLGDVTHVSPLLRRVRQLSGCAEDQVGEWLLKCAVGRGATHYERDFPSELPPDNPALTNEELGVALCLGHLPWNPALLRAAAQLLSAPDVNIGQLARLAEMERVEPVLLYIAEVAARFTLDALPGKQMAIDAELNAGLVNEIEARERRHKLEEEADFYGAMDGASKFVRGDAIAAILITLINIVGGPDLSLFEVNEAAEVIKQPKAKASSIRPYGWPSATASPRW